MIILSILFWLAVLAAVGILGVIIYLIFREWQLKRQFAEMGVPFISPGYHLVRLLTGQISYPEAEIALYKDAVATGNPIVGMSDSFTAPGYYVTDLDLARAIYVKDFEYFVNRRKFTVQEDDLLTKKMLVSLDDHQWKGLRSKISPTFTTGKIKRMFHIFAKSGEGLCTYLKQAVGVDGGEYDVCEAFSKCTLDVIASCAFGIDSRAYQSRGLSEFEQMAQKLQFKFSFGLLFKSLLVMLAPRIAKFFGVGFQPMYLTPQKYYLKVIKSCMEHRKESGERREDFLQLMMDAQQELLKDEETSKESMEVLTGCGVEEATTATNSSFWEEGGAGPAKVTLDDEDIVANCVLFLVGGSDTTQSLLIFAAYQLALEPEVQEKLLEEVRREMDGNEGKLTYEGVMGLEYLGMFIQETLRYFPPAMKTERTCTKDYKIPGSNNVIIKKGQLVALPVLGLHRDSKHYQNPDKFDPERFLPDKKGSRHPYAYAPFGHGPRSCIGMRFALIEVKAIIARLVYNFKLEPGSRTEIPPKFASSSSLKPKNGMWLKITPRF